MNLAVDLIMAALVFRLCNLRYGGVDLLPDVFGMLALLGALLILRKKDYEFRGAFLPWTFALVLSGWSLYNFMPKEPSALFGVQYAVAEGLLLLTECLVYYRLMVGFEQVYSEKDKPGRGAVWLYGLSKTAGIALNLILWVNVAKESYVLTLAYYGWVLVHIVVTTWLIYRFYLLKPKFRPVKKTRGG